MTLCDRELTPHEIILILSVSVLIIILAIIYGGIHSQNIHEPGVEPALSKLHADPSLVYSCQNEIWKNTTHSVTVQEGSVGKGVEVVNIYRVCYFRDNHVEISLAGTIPNTVWGMSEFLNTRGNDPLTIPYVWRNT